MMLAVIAMLVATQSQGEEYLNGIKWEEPAIVTPGKTNADPPSDAVILFDGSSLDNWKNGKNWDVKDGVAYSGKGKITSNDSFGDCQVHVEWTAPIVVKGNGQGRGNSGIFLMDRYEIQVLDSYDNETYFDGQAGAIYKQTPPSANAMRPPGEWNTYDIFWTAPRFDEQGELVSPAYITAVHNGVLILNHFELKGDTPYNRPPAYSKHADTGPISIQDHGNPVGFRNIWVREFTPAKGEQVRKPFLRNGTKETPLED
ncbi:MAG: 3-keto-disaccharide hydrolase [Rubripirellula sp.]